MSHPARLPYCAPARGNAPVSVGFRRSQGKIIRKRFKQMRKPFSGSSLRLFAFPCLLAFLLILAGRAAQAEISVKLDRKDGDKISDVSRLSATVESKADVEKVEF